MTKLRVSIVGRTSPDCKDEDNPFIYFRDDRVQDAVLYVASEFPARAGLYDRYKEISGPSRQSISSRGFARRRR